MKRFALLALLLTSTSCTFLRALFSPSTIATIDQCGEAELQPAINSLFTQVLKFALQPATSATAVALDALAATLPEGEAAVGCILRAISAAGRVVLDGGSIANVIASGNMRAGALMLDPATQSNIDANLEAYEARHKRIAVLPVPPAVK